MDRRDAAKLATRQFSGRLKAARKQAALTQDRLAEMLGISPISLSRLETGASLPSFEIFVGLCLALDVSPSYMVSTDRSTVAVNAEARVLIDELALVSEQLDPEWIGYLLALAKKAARSTGELPRQRPK